MFEALPIEGLIGIGAFVVSIILLALIHGVSSAVQSAQASRREAARLVDQLSALMSAIDRSGTDPKGPAGAPSPRPVKRRRAVAARRAPANTKKRYGPRSMAQG
ncbi:hypothetical protein [Pyruvatibacter sp.]|uniref:hypothetical protein n=1 Tax=Pyruvatibacter sp. TaxID=1981328 RepID=UPI0032ED1264